MADAHTSMTSDGVRHEVELKYRVTDVAALQAFLDGPWTADLPDVTMTEATIKQVEDRYFDTVRGALQRHGFGARLRRTGGGITLTVKSLTPEDADGSIPAEAMHRRIELEGPANGRLDPEGWPSSPARELVDELQVRPLLNGSRGATALDVDAVVRTIVRLSVLADDLGEDLDALDVNPLIALPEGCVAVDALVIPRAR